MSYNAGEGPTFLRRLNLSLSCFELSSPGEDFLATQLLHSSTTRIMMTMWLNLEKYWTLAAQCLNRSLSEMIQRDKYILEGGKFWGILWNP